MKFNTKPQLKTFISYISQTIFTFTFNRVQGIVPKTVYE